MFAAVELTSAAVFLASSAQSWANSTAPRHLWTAWINLTTKALVWPINVQQAFREENPRAIFAIFVKVWLGLVYWSLTPQQQPGSYQGGEMMMKSVFWWRKPEYPEETGVPRGNRSTQRKPEYPEETGVPRGNRSTRRKLEYPEETTNFWWSIKINCFSGKRMKNIGLSLFNG